MNSYYKDDKDVATYYKYIHINSQHISYESDNAKFLLHLVQPLRNVKQVALKNFSMANTM